MCWAPSLVKACLLQLYIPWNYHERYPGEYTWDGMADVFSFIELIQELEMVVLLRVGPYICAEWDFGGLPWWLGSSQVSSLQDSHCCNLLSCSSCACTPIANGCTANKGYGYHMHITISSIHYLHHMGKDLVIATIAVLHAHDYAPLCICHHKL